MFAYEFEEFIERLIESEKPIIVEGKKDKAALEKIGAKKVFQIKGPLFKFIESLEEFDSVVILTDLDKEGKKIYGKLAGPLSQRGVKIDNYFREFLLKTKLSHIEGIETFARNLKDLRKKQG